MTVTGEPVRITSNGRRYFSRSHKEAVVAKCLVPGASLSAVALANGFNANLVRKWVRQHGAPTRRSGATVLPVTVAPPARAQRIPDTRVGALSVEPGAIEIRLGSLEVILHGRIDSQSLAQVLEALTTHR